MKNKQHASACFDIAPRVLVRMCRGPDLTSNVPSLSAIYNELKTLSKVKNKNAVKNTGLGYRVTTFD